MPESKSHFVDLGAELAKLRLEPASARGFRKSVIYRQGGVVQVLFAFEPGGELTDHAAHGLVTIQGVEGALSVRVFSEPRESSRGLVSIGAQTQPAATGKIFSIAAGTMLNLAPGIVHAVHAEAAAAMLLTISK